jgi:hypothetical protein
VRPARNRSRSFFPSLDEAFDLADDGKIAQITDFWPEPYELPASRAHLVERY